MSKDPNNYCYEESRRKVHVKPVEFRLSLSRKLQERRLRFDYLVKPRLDELPDSRITLSLERLMGFSLTSYLSCREQDHGRSPRKLDTGDWRE